MADIIKSNGHKTKAELNMELAVVDNKIGRLCTRAADLKERHKQLIEAKRVKCQKEDEEIREIRRELVGAEDLLIEAIGGRKMALALLAKLGVTPENTKYDRMLTNERTGAVLQSVANRTEG